MALTQDDMNAVKVLVKAGRIDQAQALLQSIDDDRARLALIKLNERYPEMKAKVSKPKAIHAVGIAVVVIALLLVSLGWPALQSYINRVQIRMESVCQQKFISALDKYTYQQLADACKEAARHAIDTHNDEIQYCFDSFGQTDKRFEECIDDQSVPLYPDFVWASREKS